MFKNKSLLVTPVNTQDATNEVAPIPQKVNHIYELAMLIDFNAIKLVKVAIAYKTATTLLRAAEHVVVTKVK